MLGFRSLLLASIAVASVMAATTPNDTETATIRACLKSTEIYNFPTEVTYSTTDDTHYLNATWSYDIASCTTYKVPIGRITAESEFTGDVYTCTGPTQYDSTGFAHAQCSVTLGTLARSAEEGDNSCKRQSPRKGRR